MSTRTLTAPARRHRLSRDQVLRVAMTHADERGLEALTMRGIADELGVAPMALYRHVASKDDLVDGLVDVVFGEIALPSLDGAWKTAMRARAISLRDVLARHHWAIGLMEARSRPGPANLRHHDTVIGSLRAAGFDMASVAHAYSLLDAYIYGYALTKMNLPFDETTDMAAMADQMLAPYPGDEYPNMVAFITDHALQPGYDFAAEFEYGLDAILDALERDLAPG